MMRVGENSGTLDAILPEMIDYPNELLKKAIATQVGLIPSTMTAYVGLVYATFLGALFAVAGESPK